MPSSEIEKTLSSVEQDYLDSIKILEQNSKLRR